MTCVERKNLNLDVPQAIDRLLDKARSRGKGNFSPAVAASVYAFFVEMDAKQRDEVFERYRAWLKSIEEAADDEQAAAEVVLPARTNRPRRNKEAG